MVRLINVTSNELCMTCSLAQGSCLRVSLTCTAEHSSAMHDPTWRWDLERALPSMIPWQGESWRKWLALRIATCVPGSGIEALCRVRATFMDMHSWMGSVMRASHYQVSYSKSAKCWSEYVWLYISENVFIVPRPMASIAAWNLFWRRHLGYLLLWASAVLGAAGQW